MPVRSFAATLFLCLSLTSLPAYAEPIRYTFEGTLETGDPVRGRFTLVPFPPLPGYYNATNFSFSTPVAPTGDIEIGWWEYFGVPFYSVDRQTSMLRWYPFPMPEAGRIYDPRYITPSLLQLAFPIPFPGDEFTSGLPLTICEATGDACQFESRWNNENRSYRLTSGTATPVPEPGSTFSLFGIGLLAVRSLRQLSKKSRSGTRRR